MKKLIFIIAILVTVIGCDKEKEEEQKDKSEMLVGRWLHFKTELMTDGKVTDTIMLEEEEYSVIFRINNTGNTGASEFNWLLHENTLSLIGETWSEDYTVKTLTSTSLIINIGTASASETYYHKKIE